jgi:anti-sigma B factor antagonist
MSLKLRMRKHNDIPILALSGDAVGQGVSKVAEKINDLIESGNTTIVIDCSELNAVDSHGLGMFVFSWKLMDSQKRRLVFMNPSEFVKNLFEGSNLQRVFTIIDSIEAL